MSAEENKVTVRRLAEEVFNKGGMSVVPELIAHDYVYNSPFGEFKGPLGFLLFAAMTRSAFPDIHMTIDDMVAEGDKVVISWNVSGTHQGPLQEGNLKEIPPTGKKVKWTGITIYRIVDGKVIEEKCEENTLGLMRQIGVVPPTG